MTTQVHKSIEVNVPVTIAYNQWTQFEEFPHFMGGVKSVTQLTDDRLEWVAEIAGVKRRWKARILQQVPDQKVAWAAIEGATNAGSVTFADLGGRTKVTLTLEYEPEGLVEKAGDALNIIERQAESDLKKFKEFIEAEGYATGAWRGTVEGGGTPGLEDATSQGDSGKAGMGKAAAAAVGLGVAAAGAAAVAGAKKKQESDVPGETITPVEGSAVDTGGADFVGDSTAADTELSTGTAGTGLGGDVGTGSGLGYGASEASDTAGTSYGTHVASSEPSTADAGYAADTGMTGGGYTSDTGSAHGDELIDDALRPATEEGDPAHPTRSTTGGDIGDIDDDRDDDRDRR